MTFSKNVHSIKHDLQAVIISLQCPTSSDVKHLKRVFRRLTGAWSWPWQLLLCSLAAGLSLDNCCYAHWLAPGLGLDNCCYAHWRLVLALTTVAISHWRLVLALTTVAMLTGTWSWPWQLLLCSLLSCWCITWCGSSQTRLCSKQSWQLSRWWATER